MKTYIWIDDGLIEKADRVALELGWSRSALVAEALREYLQKRREGKTTEQLNAVYAEDEQLLERKMVRRLRAKLTGVEKW